MKSEIESRATQLKALKSHQMRSIEKLSSEKHNLREKAAELAERYEDLRDNSERQQKRVEIVLQQIQSKLPGLSDAELKMVRTLKGYEKRTKDLTNTMEQIKAKKQYQLQQIESVKKGLSMKVQNDIGENQVNSIKEVLKKDSEEIHDLVKILNDSKKDLAVYNF